METEAASGGMALLPLIISLAITLVVLIGMWKVFAKAGQPGWAILVPIYNTIVLIQVAGKPIWWFLLLLIPGVNLIILIILDLAIAEKFGKGAGFGVGLILLPVIFYPILGFGSAEYQG